MRYIIKKVAYSFIMVTALSVLTRAIGFIFKIYLSRKLSAEALGLFQLALTFFFALLCIPCSGLPTTLSRKIAQTNIEEKKLSLTSACLIISLCISITIAFIIYLFKNYLYLIFSDTRAIPLFIILLPCLLSSSIYCSLRAYFWGKGQFSIFSSAELFEEIIRIIITVVILSITTLKISKEIGIAIAFTVADVLCTIFLVILFVIRGGKLKKPVGVGEILTSATPITTSRLSGSLISSAIAVLLPLQLVKSGFSQSDATASYGVVVGMAAPILMAPLTLIGALSTVMVPNLAKAKSKGECLYYKVDNALVFSSVMGLIYVLLIICTGTMLGKLIYNNDLAGEYILNSVFVILPFCFYSITATMLNSIGKEKHTFISYLIGAVLMVICVTFLPSKIGIYSLSVGQGIGYSVSSFINLVILSKVGATKCGYIWRFAKLCINTFVAYTLHRALNPILLRIATPLASNIITTFIAILCFCILVLVTENIRFSIIFGKKKKSKKCYAI